ncbi:MAG: hypothetical protein JNK82_08395 [Myxococcaceae bacterium]|nr:hypothetical protein [Myxococcaceae bacterium]
MAALLEQAGLHQQRGEWQRSLEVLAPVVEERDAPAEALGVYSDALRKLDRADEARAVLERALKSQPDEPSTLARMGSLLVDESRPLEGVRLLERAKRALGRDPSVLVHLGFAQLRAHLLDQAQASGEASLQRGGGDEAKLLLAAVKTRKGDYRQAIAMATALEEKTTGPLRAAAASVRADALLFSGEAAAALEVWKGLHASGQVAPGQLPHMAYAAQVAGDAELASRLIEQRMEGRPAVEDRLLFAQIFNLRGKPAEALAMLDGVLAAGAGALTGIRYEVLATRARALRLLGRSGEAREMLDDAAAMPEYVLPRLGARVRIDRGHLAAEEGDFEKADVLFKEALALDPGDPEAARALELTSRKVAWKSELQAGADAQVAAARAEADALGRRFRSRESELDALRRELEHVKAAQAKAEAAADAAKAAVKAALERAQLAPARAVAEELATRELEIETKADDAVERALFGVRDRCPDEVVRLLRVAERTFQKALYIALPAAAVAVLYAGALERALVVLLAERFGAWLDEKKRRQAFLDGAVRERRGSSVTYFNHFVEAFDPGVGVAAPSLGEVERALERRGEPFMAAFVEFLRERYPVPDVYFGELAAFVQWTKERVRDPAAHGRALEVGYEDLRRFRDELLFDFRGKKRGALATLLGATA